MCLFVDSKKTASERRKKGELITCYKFFDIIGGRVVTPYRGFNLNLDTNLIKVKGRIDKPESYIKPFNLSDGGIVDAGVHAFTVKSGADGRAKWYPNRVVTKCYGYREDLIAVGEYQDIAFTKLYIDEEDYQMLLDECYGKDKYTHADV